MKVGNKCTFTNLKNLVLYVHHTQCRISNHLVVYNITSPISHDCIATLTGAIPVLRNTAAGGNEAIQLHTRFVAN